MSELYASYGSNVNPGQMAYRCKTAKYVGPSELKGWKLAFRATATKAVATILPEAGAAVPVVIWQIEAEDEAALDTYEGVKYKLYRKDHLPVVVNGKTEKCLVYILNKPGKEESPSQEYFKLVEDGYKAAGIDTAELRKIAGRD